MGGDIARFWKSTKRKALLSLLDFGLLVLVAVTRISPAGLIMPLLHNISRVISTPADLDQVGKNRLE